MCYITSAHVYVCSESHFLELVCYLIQKFYFSPYLGVNLYYTSYFTIAQFRHIKIQLETKHITTRLRGII